MDTFWKIAKNYNTLTQTHVAIMCKHIRQSIKSTCKFEFFLVFTSLIVFIEDPRASIFFGNIDYSLDTSALNNILMASREELQSQKNTHSKDYNTIPIQKSVLDFISQS